MSNKKLPIQIDVIGNYVSFYSPPQSSILMVLRHQSDGHWGWHDEMSLESGVLESQAIEHFVRSLDEVDPEPLPERFNRSADELNWHFGGVSTGSAPTLLVELHYLEQECVRIRTQSNHILLLPWITIGGDRVANYNPEVSAALAALLPKDELFHRWLTSSDQIFESETAIRKEIALRDQERSDGPEQTYEQQKARIDAMLQHLHETMLHGEPVEFEKGKADYTANQLRCLSQSELLDLASGGFDLSTSDETGQTALMLAAFPPFNQEQFEKLVAAGADVNAHRTDGMTGLLLACSGGMVDTVPFWIAAGADVELRGPGGCSALMLAAKYPKIVQALLDRNADVLATDEGGDTALDYATFDQRITQAGAMLESIEILSRRIGELDVASLERSLKRATETARRIDVHNRVLIKLGTGPLSARLAEARKKAESSDVHKSFVQGMNELIDLQITESELANRILAIIGAEIDRAMTSVVTGESDEN